jgi:hypothetical protein
LSAAVQKKKKNKNQFQIKPSMNLSNPQVKSILASTLGQTLWIWHCHRFNPVKQGIGLSKTLMS